MNTESAIDQFRAAMSAEGVPPPDVIEADGELHRFPTNGNGSDDAGWYVFHDDGIPAGCFGDWRNGFERKWRADIGRKLTSAEEAAHRNKIETMRREREEAKLREQAEAATKATAIWGSSIPAPADHQYLVRKGIKAHGARLHNQALVVSMRDGAEINSLQFIGADSEKKFLTGGRVKGCYFSIGSVNGAKALCVVEGFATGASIHETTGLPVAVAFSADNLDPVATKLHSKIPDLQIVVCADDDYRTDGNPGLTKAKATARSVGGVVVVPDFGTERPDGATDFNDMAAHCGLDAVKQVIEAAITPAAPERLPLDVVFADALPESFTPPDEIVEGVFVAGDGSVVYGDSGSGKTTLVVDLCAAVTRGVPWMGRQTEPGLVIYLAAENPSSVRRRLQAYQKHHEVRVPNFAIVQNPIDLFSADADTDKIIEVVRQIETQRGQRARLIVGDTLARLSAGANENSGQDMGLVVQRIDRIRAECNVHFLLIHHSGKNAAAGARGWSGVRAAIDTEIEVTDTPTGRCAEITKQRDLGSKGERIGFRLEVITMGLTKWKALATSCVVVSTEAPPKQKDKRMGQVEGAIVEFLTASKTGVRRKEVVAHFDGRYQKGPIYRAINKLIEAQIILDAAGIIGVAGGAG